MVGVGSGVGVGVGVGVGGLGGQDAPRLSSATATTARRARPASPPPGADLPDAPEATGGMAAASLDSRLSCKVVRFDLTQPLARPILEA